MRSKENYMFFELSGVRFLNREPVYSNKTDPRTRIGTIRPSSGSVLLGSSQVFFLFYHPYLRGLQVYTLHKLKDGFCIIHFLLQSENPWSDFDIKSSS